jgi:hypothetical protein
MKVIGKAIDNLKTYADLCGMRWVGSVTALAKMPRETSQSKDVEKRIRRLAKKFVRTLGQ